MRCAARALHIVDRCDEHSQGRREKRSFGTREPEQSKRFGKTRSAIVLDVSPLRGSVVGREVKEVTDMGRPVRPGDFIASEPTDDSKPAQARLFERLAKHRVVGLLAVVHGASRHLQTRIHQRVLVVLMHERDERVAPHDVRHHLVLQHPHRLPAQALLCEHERQIWRGRRVVA
jgi:hypothetical protein